MSLSSLFTVIILVYKNSAYLCSCIDSLIAQDYESIELIVADDGSSDFCCDYFEKYIECHKQKNITRFLVYSNPENVGTVKSINIAIKKSTGRYIKTIAADDEFYNNNTLSTAKKALDSCRDGIVISNVVKCNQNMDYIRVYYKSLQKRINSLSPLECFRLLCIHNDIVAPGVFFSREFFEVYGYFDEEYRLLEDWPKWLQITEQGCHIQYYNFLSIKYRSNNGTGTSNNEDYLSDKKRAFRQIIIPAKKKIGLNCYFLSLLSFSILNSKFNRKAYSFFFRKTQRI